MKSALALGLIACAIVCARAQVQTTLPACANPATEDLLFPVPQDATGKPEWWCMRGVTSSTSHHIVYTGADGREVSAVIGSGTITQPMAVPSSLRHPPIPEVPSSEVPTSAATPPPPSFADMICHGLIPPANGGYQTSGPWREPKLDKQSKISPPWKNENFPPVPLVQWKVDFPYDQDVYEQLGDDVYVTPTSGVPACKNIGSRATPNTTATNIQFCSAGIGKVQFIKVTTDNLFCENSAGVMTPLVVENTMAPKGCPAGGKMWAKFAGNRQSSTVCANPTVRTAATATKVDPQTLGAMTIYTGSVKGGPVVYGFKSTSSALRHKKGGAGKALGRKVSVHRKLSRKV